MNTPEPAPYTSSGSVVEGDSQTSLDDAIHLLAQPLTALSFVLDLACLRDDPGAWREALGIARTECRRAIQALEQVRSAAVDDVSTPDGLSSERTENHW